MLYGTTQDGGASGNGTVYSISTTGTLTTIYSFQGSDGSHPTEHLIKGSDGNFYGTTSYGGAHGKGTVYKITPAGVLSTVYSFTGGTDGNGAVSALILAKDGNFYGTTQSGGADGHGNVFKLTPAGIISTLYSFTGGADGDTPYGGVIQASDGNFYGTTYIGGANSLGTAFRLTPGGALTTLYSFGAKPDANQPFVQLLEASSGILYGTANGGSGGYGAVFSLTGALSDVPEAPTLSLASAGDAQVALSWTASPGANSYSLYQGTAAGAESGTPVQTGLTNTSATVTGLSNGTPYYFKVAAVGDDGTSDLSNEVSATPLAIPSAPDGLSATAGDTQVSLSWSAATGATSYIVYQGTAAGAETPVATGVTDTSYTAAGLSNGQTYYFTVAGVNTSGTGPQSGEASATPAAGGGGTSGGTSGGDTGGGTSGGTGGDSGGGSTGGGGGGVFGPALLLLLGGAAFRRRRMSGKV